MLPNAICNDGNVCLHCIACFEGKTLTTFKANSVKFELKQLGTESNLPKLQSGLQAIILFNLKKNENLTLKSI
jgi:hypothetical protein